MLPPELFEGPYFCRVEDESPHRLLPFSMCTLMFSLVSRAANPDLVKLPMYCVVAAFKDPYDTKDMRTTSNNDVNFAMDVPPVRGMPEQLVQVFVNLFTNACHALPRENGELVLTTDAQGNSTYLTELGALPDKPLVALVPVSTRRDGDAGGGGHVEAMDRGGSALREALGFQFAAAGGRDGHR